jgi:tetratricopeptide (TPR) repeat protein
MNEMNSTHTDHLRARCHAALQRGDVEGAWRELSPLEDRLEHDRPAALAWLDLLRLTPERARLQGDVSRLLRHWALDALVVTRACDALIRRAELSAPDEPGADREALARAAVDAAQRCLSASTDSSDELRGFLQVSLGNAQRLCGEYEQALTNLSAALAQQPDRGGWWFNLGLLHKARHEFREGLQVNRRARALLGQDKAVLWNLAICATALGDGPSAVEALRSLGHAAELSQSGMPFVPDLPPVTVRVATLGSGHGGSAIPERSVGFELLWVTPLSPCHGVVSSASYRDASTDYGDLVLWDGVPVGMSMHEGRPVPRFPLLAVLRKGDEHRFRFVALQQSQDQVASLARELPADARLFIHHERIEKLCSRCASGEFLAKHRHEPPEEHRLVYGKLIVPAASDLPSFRRELEGLLRRVPGVQLVVPQLLEQVGDTAAAGNAHRLWRALSARADLAARPDQPSR